jgi:RecA/RadA recombinase
MRVAAAIRVQVEATLAQRVPAALTLKIKQAPELFATGMAEVDAMLGGGFPRSSITEVSGTASTGKTSFALSTLAKCLRLAGRERCAIAGIGCGCGRGLEKAALVADVRRAQAESHRQAVVKIGSSSAGH